MGIVSSVAGGVVSSILQSNVINRLADLIPDPSARQRAMMDFQEQLTIVVANSDVAQGPVNAAEAAREDKFISYWRPAVGWMCVAGLGYHLMIIPTLLYITTLSGHVIPAPDFDTNTMITILMGMLGLGALRTVERVAKINADSQ